MSARFLTKSVVPIVFEVSDQLGGDRLDSVDPAEISRFFGIAEQYSIMVSYELFPSG